MVDLARGLGLALRDAIRSIRRGRARVGLAAAILTVAMTAATVTFAVVDPLAIRALPFQSPDRLVALALPSAQPGRVLPVSPADFLTWRDQAGAFEGLAAVRGGGQVTLRSGSVTTEVSSRRVTWNLFGVLGVRPVLGRSFGPEHEQPGGPRAVVLSYALWAGRLARDPDIVGRVITLGDDAYAVAGVLPRGVRYPMTGPTPDLYVPYVVTLADRENNRGFSMLVVGRLRPGMTLDRAQADPQVAPAVVVPLPDYVIGPAKAWLRLVLIAIGMMLLIASMNVAGLFLAQGLDRQPELATREALGASRAQVVAALAIEGLIVAGVAAIGSVGLAALTLPAVTGLLPPGLTRTEEIAVDARVIGAAFLAAAAGSVVFAVIPAWVAGRRPLSSTMKAAGGPLVAGQPRAMTAFLVGNTAVSAALLVPSVLVITSLVLLVRADLGFDRRNVVQIEWHNSLGKIPGSQHGAAIALAQERLLSLARSVPGVRSAALTEGLAPLSGARNGARMDIPGYGRTEGRDVESHRVSHDYFDVLGIALKRGRLFAPTDGPTAPRVMVINELAASRFFKGRDPLGQVVDFSGPVTIVGVVATVYATGPEDEPLPAVYTLLSQGRRIALPGPNGEPRMVGRLVVRLDDDPMRGGLAVREAIRPGLSGFEPGALTLVEDLFGGVTALRRFNAQLMTAFGGLALLLGACGIYATMSFAVRRQMPALALRAMVGASPARLAREVVLVAGRLALVGTAAGLLFAWFTSSAMRRFVYGLEPADLRVYAAIIAVLLLAALVAAAGPARRATRASPLSLLRLS
jgi:predicted permease